MNEVYLAGRGLASALGADLAQALPALRGGGVDSIDFEWAPGETTPYFVLHECNANALGSPTRTHCHRKF